MQLTFDALLEYKPGDIDKESPVMQARYAAEVRIIHYLYLVGRCCSR